MLPKTTIRLLTVIVLVLAIVRETGQRVYSEAVRGAFVVLWQGADRIFNEVAFLLSKLTLEKYFRDDDGHDKPWLFPQLLAITKRWLDECLHCKGGTFPQLLLFVRYAHRAADRIYRSIVSSTEGKPTLKPMLRPYEPVGSTRYVDFQTIRTTYKTRADKCHVSHVALDSDWESKLAQELEDMAEVIAYAKNQGLGFTIPYTFNGVERNTSRISSSGSMTGDARTIL